MALDDKMKYAAGVLFDDDPLANMATRGLYRGISALGKGVKSGLQRLRQNNNPNIPDADDAPPGPQRVGPESGDNNPQNTDNENNWNWLKGILANIAGDISTIKNLLSESVNNQEDQSEKLRLQDKEDQLENRNNKPIVQKSNEKEKEGMSSIAKMAMIAAAIAAMLLPKFLKDPKGALNDAIDGAKKAGSTANKKLREATGGVLGTTIKTPKTNLKSLLSGRISGPIFRKGFYATNDALDNISQSKVGRAISGTKAFLTNMASESSVGKMIKTGASVASPTLSKGIDLTKDIVSSAKSLLSPIVETSLNSIKSVAKNASGAISSIPVAGKLLGGVKAATKFGLKGAIPGISGILSFSERRDRGDSLPNALIGSGLELAGGVVGEALGAGAGLAGSFGVAAPVTVPAGAIAGNIGGSKLIGGLYDWLMGNNSESEKQTEDLEESNENLETSNERLKGSVDKLQQTIEGRYGLQSPMSRRSIREQFNQKSQELMPRLMKDLNLNEIEAAAILGNLGHESAGLTPGIQEANPLRGRGGLGYAQWTGIRRRQFENYANRRGASTSDPETNYQFFLHDLRGRYKGALDALRLAPNDLKSKTISFEQNYENSGVKAYSSRMSYANRALELYANQDANSSQKIREANKIARDVDNPAKNPIHVSYGGSGPQTLVAAGGRSGPIREKVPSDPVRWDIPGTVRGAVGK